MRIFAILTATVAGFLCGVWTIRRKCHKADDALLAAEEYAAELDNIARAELDKAARDAWEFVTFSPRPWFAGTPKDYIDKKYFISAWKTPKSVV